MSRPQTPPPPVGERIVDVVSVQSQVAYGNVGNNIAVPVLQALDLQVAPVPTVVFGNTPHYPTMHGGPLPLDWFKGLLDDLEAREAATRAKRVLVGYLGSPEQGIALAEWLRRMREVNPALRVQIDPVIGDHDYGIYTDPALLPVWRDHLMPLAEGLCPNHFEVGHLAGRSPRTLDECLDAAEALLGDATRWVVVTSAAPELCPPGRIQLAIVADGVREVREHPLVPHPVKGVGDMFAAMIAGRLENGADLLDAVDRTCADVVEVLHAQGEDLRTPEEAEERVLDVLRERVIEPMKQGLSDLSESGLPYFDMALNVDVSSRSTDLPVILEPDQGTEEELSEQYPGTVWERKTRAEFDLEREMESRSERANSADTGPEEDGGCNIPYPHTHLPDGTPVPVLPILVGSGEEERAIPLEDLPDLLYRIARDVAQRREEEETVSGFKRDVSLEA